jgi:uncharacterized protein YecT (DUF1311 family)
LLAVAVLALSGCGTATTRVSAPQPPQRPSLPTKAPRDEPSCPAHPGTTVAIGACEGRDRLRLDARFDRAVNALWPLLDAKAKRDFAEGQRSWSRYVANECDVAYRQFLGGTEAPLAAGWCFNRLTRARLKDVSAMLASYTQGR